MSLPRLLPLVLLVACIDGGGAKDRDNDGYQAFQAGGDDCDDDDPAVNPGEDEVCGNDVDDDCDGFVDDDGLGGGTFYADADEDTFGDPDEAVTACVAPGGYVAVAGDCDDGVAAVNPDATEVWYDGIDQDCDEADDYDQDGDGFRSEAEAEDGDDCEDTLEAVNPDATEVCDNGLDDDCDGDQDGCDWRGQAPETALISFPTSALVYTTLGDANGDGAWDLVAWAEGSGTLYLFFGPLAGASLDTGDADVVITLPALDPGYEHVANLEQDLSGDGGADLVVGSWEPGAAGVVRVFSGLTPSTADLGVGDAWLTWTGPSNGTSSTERGFGHRVVPLGRYNGANRTNLALPFSAPGDDRCFLVVDSPSSGAIEAVADLTIDVCSDVVPGALDQNGDLHALVRVGFNDYYLMPPFPAEDPIDATEQTPARLYPLNVEGRAIRVVPDVDLPGATFGYGDTELLSFETNSATATLRLSSPPIGEDTTPPRTLVLRADASGPIEEFHDGHVADVNGDGALDFAVLTDFESTGDDGGTGIGMLFGTFSFVGDGTADRSSFDLVVDVPAGERYFTLLPGDLDGDGYTDVVLAGPGKVRVYYGRGW